MPQPWLKEALDEEDAQAARRALVEIIEHYKGQSGESGKVELYTTVGMRLSEMVGKEPPWSWRYISSVVAPQNPVKPSRELAKAIQAHGAYLDGLPKMVAASEPVQVYAIPGQVKPGSIIYGQSARCPNCGVWFVPDNPLRRKCKTCSPPRPHHKKEVE